MIQCPLKCGLTGSCSACNLNYVPKVSTFPLPIQKGWMCPKCDAVMAPSYPTCVNCTGKK